MAGPEDEQKPHFIIGGFAQAEQFRPPGTRGPRGHDVPERDRAQHGGALQQRISGLRPIAQNARILQEDAGLEEGFGLQIEFESFPDIELAFESLARERSGIELLNVRHTKHNTFATIFVPDGMLDHFERLIREYLDYNTDTRGRPRDNRRLIDAIREIRAASLRSLWTDDDNVFPQTEDEFVWWEVWLPVRRDRRAVVGQFRQLARGTGLQLAPGTIEFPERTVLLAYASAERMRGSILTLNCIAELRRAKETAQFFDSLSPTEQSEWGEDALRRIKFSPENAEVPHVCLLDTGVNRGHPLLEQALAAGDLHSIEPAWGVDDQHGHGTQMAGLSLFGDLTPLLDDNEPRPVDHRLESVKMLPADGGNAGDPQLHGHLTIQAVARPEIDAPLRKRLFASMLTARDHRDRGRPSAWSASIDRLASDADEQGEIPRLFILAAGNIEDPDAWATYPDSNTSDGIHDPGQAWNALTVGAYTDRVRITESNAQGYTAIASAGGLSPFSTTSVTWQDHWPLKPDVVLEGGNAAKDRLGAVWMPSLSLLTTNNQPLERLFTTANATSAATALAARMAAQLWVVYPNLWPETVRALLVHSAEWTQPMRDAFARGAHPTKAVYRNLVRHCGFGVPNLARALWSASDSLTMIAQERLYPYMREDHNQPKLREMHLHRLPWPAEELEALGETPVELRVTLSYFIEPNPSRRGVKSRYRYESYGLRYDVKRPLESDADFRFRINARARDEEEGSRVGGTDPNWLLGTQNRHRGSLHSDMWKGTAADLASRGTIAVYPTLGWWKTRTQLERYNRAARYVLIVSIRAPEADVDLYTPVANQVGAAVGIET